MPKKKMNKYDREHLRRLAAYQRMIDSIYDEYAAEAAEIGGSVRNLAPDTLFSFARYPQTRKRANKLISGLKTDLLACIVNGVGAEWTLANNKNNELSRMVFGNRVGQLSQAQYRKYFSTNDAAREAFLSRKVGGLDLSERVWRYANQFKGEIELGLDVGIRNGLSAAQMTRDLRDYLRHPDKLFRRVRDEHGTLQLSKAAAEFHPGQGVYRSSYKNARRLAATETNMAYHTSDYHRWNQLDFVVGIEIRLAGNHTGLGADGKPHEIHDICDDLAGRYPKDFKFTGWHPHCRCQAVSIIKTEKEIDEATDAILEGREPDPESVNTVHDVPEAFDRWVEDNKERAKGWSTMPYFIRQNPQYVKGFEVDTYTPTERKFTRARRTNEAMEESLGIFLQSRYPNIPNTEKAALFHYTQGDRSAFRQLNNQLRKGNLSEFNEAFADLLTAGLEKLPMENAISYRTIRLNKTRLAEFIGLADSQAEAVWKGFTSSSLDRSTAEQFAMSHAGKKKNETDVLIVINGKSGHLIEDFSEFGGRFSGRPNQREILHNRGMKVRFLRVEVENGWPVFYVEEL